MKYSNHHKVPRSRWGTNENDNRESLRVTQHQALHTLFENQTTIEKIETILNMDETVLQGDFLRDIQPILDLYKWLEYHSHCRKDSWDCRKPYKF